MLVAQPFTERALTAAASLEPFAAAVKSQVPAGSPVYFFGRVLRPLVVYVGRPIPRLRGDLTHADATGGYLIVVEDDLPHVRRLRPDAQILAEHSGRVGNLARGRVALVALPPIGG
jgi:hypothetical protein